MPLYIYKGKKYDLPQGTTKDQIEGLIASGKYKPVKSSKEKEEESSVLSSVGDTILATGTTVADVGQGVGAGIVGLGQGIAETGALGLDLVLGTNTSRSVTDGFNKTKDFLGLTPETGAGKTVETLTTLGLGFVPVIGWVGRASSVANNLSKAGKAKGAFFKAAENFGNSKTGKALLQSDNNILRRGKQALATSVAGGAVESVVLPDGTHTLADHFEILPDALETESDSGLEGRDEAYRRLRNKARLFGEGVGAGLAFEAAFPVIGTTTKLVSQVPGVPAVVGGIADGFSYLGSKAVEGIEGAGVPLRKWFTSAGATPKEIFENIQSAQTLSETQAKVVSDLLSGFESSAKKAIKRQKIFGRGRTGVNQAFDDLLGYLEGDVKALDRYNDATLIKTADKMRGQIDELSDLAIKELQAGVDAGTINSELAIGAIREIEHNKGSYLRRIYEGAFTPDASSLKQIQKKPAYKKAIQQIAKIITKNDPSLTNNEAITQATDYVQGYLTKGSLDEGLSTEAAFNALNARLVGPLSQDGTGRFSLINLSEDLFRKRSKFFDKAPALRELLNEVRDPKSTYIKTVSDLSTFVSANKFFNSLAMGRRSYDEAFPEINAFLQNGMQGPRPLVVSGENVTPPMKRTLEAAGYVKMGDRKAIAGKGSGKTIFAGQYGDISGDFIQKEIYNAISAPVRSMNVGDDLLALALQAKGLSQVGKTVLSPIGQMRNFNSGTFFLMANGNTLRNLDVGASAQATYGKVSALSNEESDALFTMANDLGLVDGNLAVNEIQRLLKETAGTTTRKISDATNVLLNETPILKSATKLYSDTDTFYKINGFLAEKAKYGSAFKKAGVTPNNIDSVAQYLKDSGVASRTSELSGKYGFQDIFAADIVKETMPIYSRVPEVVKGIRRVPFIGSFMSFPAEIIRNTANIVGRGSRELSFKAIGPDGKSLIRGLDEKQAAALQREIRAIGANRLAGYVASAAVVPSGIQRASMMANDITEEERKAMNSFLPFYNKGDQLIIFGKSKDDVIEYGSISYLAPYDYFLAPARTALQTYQEKGELGADEVNQISSALFESSLKIFEPFLGESMISEAVFEAARGETRTGRTIWENSNDIPTRIAKGVGHVFESLNPAVLDQYGYKLTPRGIEPGRVPSAIAGIPSGSGREYNLYEEFLAQVTGIRGSKLDIPKSLGFLGYEFIDKRGGSYREFGSVAKANNTTKEDVINQYIRSNEDLFRHQKILYKQIQDAKTLGLSPKQIYNSLRRQSKLGKKEFNMIYNGKFRPISLTEKLFKDVFKETAVKGEARLLRSLPARELGAIYRSLAGKSLKVEEPEGSFFNIIKPAGASTLPSAPVAEPIQSATPQAGATASIVPPNTQAQSAPVQPRDPFLLGGNPIDVLKNQQIAQRLQGQ